MKGKKKKEKKENKNLSKILLIISILCLAGLSFYSYTYLNVEDNTSTYKEGGNWITHLILSLITLELFYITYIKLDFINEGDNDWQSYKFLAFVTTFFGQLIGALLIVGIKIIIKNFSEISKTLSFIILGIIIIIGFFAINKYIYDRLK